MLKATVLFILSGAPMMAVLPASAQQAPTCITPVVRCLAGLPGPPGSPCQCLGEAGPVAGVLG